LLYIFLFFTVQRYASLRVICCRRVSVRPFVYQYPVNVAWLRLRKQGHRKE